jgi:hypothetical protein
MKNIPLGVCWICAVCLYSSPSWGVDEPKDQTGGYQLFDADGRKNSTEGDLVVTAKPKADQTTSGKPKSLSALLPPIIDGMQRTVREEPPANSTTAQLDEFTAKKHAKLMTAITPLAGSSVSFNFKVKDVLDSSDAKHLVIGVLDWKSPLELTRDDRLQIAKINKDVDDREKAEEAEYDAGYNRGGPNATKTGAPVVLTDSEVKHRQQEKLDNDAERKKRLAEVRAAADARRPVQMVYVFTDDPSAASWHRGESHAMQGIIQKAAAFLYTPPAPVDEMGRAVTTAPNDTYIGIEFVVVGGVGATVQKGQPLVPPLNRPASNP